MESKWESKLREKMAGYSEPEPDGLWEGIAAQAGIADDHKKKNVRKIRIIPAILIPAAAAVLAVFVLSRNGGPVRMPDTLAENPAEKAMESVPDKPSAGEVGIVRSAEDSFPEKTARTESLVAEAIIPEPEAVPQEAGEAGIPAENAPDTETPASTPVTEKTDTGRSADESTSEPQARPAEGTDTAPDRMPSHPGYQWTEYDFPDTGARKRDRGKISTDIFVSNLTGSRQSYAGYSTYQPEAVTFKGIPASNAVSGVPGNGIILMTHEERSSTQVKHRQPVRAGLTFRYNFTRRWGLETGLVYSYLSSLMTSENGSQYSSRNEQVLHYLGIPLKASYNILDRRHFTIYASAGGMVEKCLYGTASASSSLNGTDTGTSDDKVTVKPIQWSVAAEAGVQWNITQLLGLYLEPGISWYFDNGSMVSTIYKEKPLNFNLEFGLRFSFE